jgi:hypothetical protein
MGKENIVADKEITEKKFVTELIKRVSSSITDAKIDSGKNVLYEMPIDDDGIVQMGVDDAGEAIRGKGTGFEQDILVYEQNTKGQTSVIPRVIAEVKFSSVTTHDAIVYSYKAECIKRIYPFCRYGMIIGDFDSIPGRVFRHGRNFDFICSIAYPFLDEQIQQVQKLFTSELVASRNIVAILKGKLKPWIVQKNLTVIER